MILHENCELATGIFLKMMNGKMLLLLKSVDEAILSSVEMYAEVSLQCHLVEQLQGDVELPQPVTLLTADNVEQSPKTLLCQLEVRKLITRPLCLHVNITPSNLV